MSTIDEVQAALLELERELLLSTIFTWNGQSYPALAAGRTGSDQFGAGGWAPNSDLGLVVRRSVFGESDDDLPGLKEFLDCNGRRYVIDQVIMPTGDPFLKLVCSDINRGA